MTPETKTALIALILARKFAPNLDPQVFNDIETALLAKDEQDVTFYQAKISEYQTRLAYQAERIAELEGVQTVTVEENHANLISHVKKTVSDMEKIANYLDFLKIDARFVGDKVEIKISDLERIIRRAQGEE